jgi:hypothetical protein
MNCRNFDRSLPDWIAGRLSPEQAAQMAQHHAGCAQCRSATLAERSLQQRLGDLSLPAHLPTIETRLAERLAQESSRPPLFVFGRPNWAMGGALAAVALACTLLMAGPPRSRPVGIPPEQAPVATADESVIVEKISEFQQLPDAESEDFLSSAGNRRSVQRTVLLGGEAQ